MKKYWTLERKVQNYMKSGVRMYYVYLVLVTSKSRSETKIIQRHIELFLSIFTALSEMGTYWMFLNKRWNALADVVDAFLRSLARVDGENS